MDALFDQIIKPLPLPILFIIVIFTMYGLAKGADLLVDEAVTLATKLKLEKVLIGATIVSLGTTLPEASVSVFAAVQGDAGLALGNAVGSIICDTGLILGLATIISPLPIIRSIVNKQGWIQIFSGILLVVCCLPFLDMENTFVTGGLLPQHYGFVFLLLLMSYLLLSIYWAKRYPVLDEERLDHIEKDNILYILFKLIMGILLIIISSKVLIPTAKETALRFQVPESVISATIVAFGTSLPELVTALTAVRKGHGDLALGNVIGADILNVLFVAGAAASVTSSGLYAEPIFFKLLFPTMLCVLLVFRLGIVSSKDRLNRIFGVILLFIYLIYTILSYKLGVQYHG